MTAGKYDFVMEQGSVYGQSFQYLDDNNSPVDLTGFTAKMQIRASYDTVVLLELNTTDATLTIDGVNGVITANVDADITALLTFTDAIYDLELYPAGNESVAFKILYGDVSLRKEVTQ